MLLIANYKIMQTKSGAKAANVQGGPDGIRAHSVFFGWDMQVLIPVDDSKLSFGKLCQPLSYNF